jgi:predicted transcriptional regulator of viral defense system
MKWIDFSETLLRMKLPVFTLREALKVSRLKYNTGKMQIARWVRLQRLVRLKNGLYALRGPFDRGEIPAYYIANRLYIPSYVSLESALSYYDLIPEQTFAVTSVCSKPTRKYVVTRTSYLFRSVQPRFLTGYSVEKEMGFDIRIAEKEKAMVDYLYFTIVDNAVPVDRLDVNGLDMGKMHRYASMLKEERLMPLIKRLC